MHHHCSTTMLDPFVGYHTSSPKRKGNESHDLAYAIIVIVILLFGVKCLLNLTSNTPHKNKKIDLSSNNFFFFFHMPSQSYSTRQNHSTLHVK